MHVNIVLYFLLNSRRRHILLALFLWTDFGVPDESLRGDLELSLEDQLVLQVGIRLGAAVVGLHLVLRGAPHDLKSSG